MTVTMTTMTTATTTTTTTTTTAFTAASPALRLSAPTPPTPALPPRVPNLFYHHHHHYHHHHAPPLSFPFSSSLIAKRLGSDRAAHMSIATNHIHPPPRHPAWCRRSTGPLYLSPELVTPRSIGCPG
ncbi:hypothetical protein HIM_09269 [Hirsutella minnesotensis 3608]|uniref:Uncharacterized protein n=1 Tax=Hirsutella minnesotensis 3608 TaxID=1043627 RepID=A0A0F7ZSG7_9HYPO|nr:hypothetical protein HIM_09269 [Hirsutella minnesotensis 3608]